MQSKYNRFIFSVGRNMVLGVRGGAPYVILKSKLGNILTRIIMMSIANFTLC